MRFLLLLPVFFLAPAVLQDPAPPVDGVAASLEPYRETATRLLEEAAARGEAYRMLESLCTTAPHRLSGSTGAATAVEWARATMEAIGLENVRLEPCSVPHWERGETETLTIVKPERLAGTLLPILALGGSVATPEGGLTASLVEVKSLDELAELGDAARGKIVFFNGPMNGELLSTFAAYGLAVGQRTQGASRAARAGGVAALVRSMTTRLDDSPHTGAMHYDPRVPERVPAAAISTNAAERIAALLAAGEEVTVHLQLSCRTMEDKPSFNVVGEIVGRERPDEIVVVGGHLDCWDVGQGAHDDGAGSCQSLEVARLLKSLNLKPRRTLRVVLFMNEENGLRGARAYRDTHGEEMGNHILAMESDRGGFTPRGFTSDAGPEAMEVLRGIVALTAPSGADRIIPGGGGADVTPMARDGVITMGYLPDSQRYFDLHHSERDTLAAVSPRELNLGAGAMAVMCYVVADLEERLPRK